MAIIAPNLFTLHGRHGLQVTLSLSSLTGEPRFSYHDGVQAVQRAGDEVAFEDTGLGRLATIELSSIPDLGRTTFTLIVPAVNLLGAVSHAVETLGLWTVRRTTIAGPPHGQSTTTRSARLRGNADQVQFLQSAGSAVEEA
jgi:hypothetical protein